MITENDITENDIIAWSCYRIDDYKNVSSADLATAIVQNVALTKTTIMPFFQQIIANGGVQSELAPLYKYSEFMADLKLNLEKGDLTVVQTLVSLAEDLVTLTMPTTMAIATAITQNFLRLVDVVAEAAWQVAPISVTAADVDAALGRNV